MKRIENMPAWRDVMKKIQERLKAPLFTTSQTVFKRGVVGGLDVAICCRHMTAVANRHPGPAKTRAHLRTISHFQRWCLERPVEIVLTRFPEVKPLLAERAILK